MSARPVENARDNKNYIMVLQSWKLSFLGHGGCLHSFPEKIMLTKPVFISEFYLKYADIGKAHLNLIELDFKNHKTNR